MEFKIAREALIALTDSVGGIVERRNTIPILSNIQLIASKDGLMARATDLDIMIEKKTSEVEVITPGETTVSSDLLQNISVKLPASSIVHISVSENRLRIRAGRSDFKLPVLPADDFPVLTSNGADGNTFKIKAGNLARALKIVEGSMSTEETRYYLNGVYIDTNRQIDDGENDVRFVATDGHRLSLTRVTMEESDVLEDSNVIVPRKAVREMIKAMSGSDEMVDVSYGKRAIRVAYGNIVFLCKLIDGTFPDYTRVIPEKTTITSKFDAPAMKQAVDRVTVVSTEKTRAVRLVVKKESVDILVTDVNAGNATEEVSAQSNEEIEIGFNSKYLADFLGQEDDQITLHMTESGAPVKIKFSSRPSDLAVIMPMRI